MRYGSINFLRERSRRPLLAAPAAIALAAITGGCGGGAGYGDGASREQAEAALMADYSGRFPCHDCPGIDISLRLGGDGLYVFEQQYLGDDGRPESRAAAIGRWRWDHDDESIRLRGEGPERVFLREGESTLLMQMPSDLEYRVERSAGGLSFDRALPLKGLIVAGQGGLTFSECSTELSLEVRSGGDTGRIWRQFRKLGDNGPVMAEIDGRLHWNASTNPLAVTVERLVSLKPEHSCDGPRVASAH